MKPSYPIKVFVHGLRVLGEPAAPMREAIAPVAHEREIARR
jgi:hypothetical protein